MVDETEAYRRAKVAERNIGLTGEQLSDQYGLVLTTDELGKDYEVLGFMAPFVIVRRKSDGVRGTFEFQHDPRYYFKWRPE